MRASGDATAASNQALAAMSTFADDQPRLSPLVDLFGGLAATIGAAKKGADVGAITGKKAGILDIFNGGSGRNVR